MLLLSDDLETMSHISFLTSADISSNIGFFHFGSCIAPLQSDETKLECREVANALYGCGSVSNEI
jgi:hypothetical protein